MVIFSVSDEEGTAVAWSLTGDDGDDFSICDGVLSFRRSPVASSQPPNGLSCLPRPQCINISPPVGLPVCPFRPSSDFFSQISHQAAEKDTGPGPIPAPAPGSGTRVAIARIHPPTFPAAWPAAPYSGPDLAKGLRISSRRDFRGTWRPQVGIYGPILTIRLVLCWTLGGEWALPNTVSDRCGRDRNRDDPQ